MGTLAYRIFQPGVQRLSHLPLHPRLKPILIRSLILATVCLLIAYEARTSALQSRIFHYYAGKLDYKLGTGASPSIVFPGKGPFDGQRGYSMIPEFQKRLQERGFRVVAQARFSPELSRMARWGIIPPYQERPITGLIITGERGVLFHDSRRTDLLFSSFDAVPPLIIKTLLFIENRELPKPADPRTNPVVEWDRLARAGFLYAGNKLGLPISVEGGSTLATQLEKYRHSERGRTSSVGDKARQMLSASLKVYREGPDTRPKRRQIILDYLNTVPLAAGPGYGEVHGLGEGLYAWFGLDLAEVMSQLSSPADTPQKAKAYRYLLTLLASIRGPSYYLIQDPKALEKRVTDYLRLLSEAGVISPAFAKQVQAAPVKYLRSAPSPRAYSFGEQKAANAIRINLMELLGLHSFYQLDRLHVEVESTLDVHLQSKVNQLFKHLKEREFIRTKGLGEERLLQSGDPSQVIYSLMMFERTSRRNLLRVQADSLDRPFDLNQGMKMELGSTAKLRTLAHYLELLTELYVEIRHRSMSNFHRPPLPSDPITAWAVETLKAEPSQGLEEFLEKALQRRYSAFPGEAFFTGGSVHYFSNFDPKHNDLRMTLENALQHSTNLVFIRLMRDLVRFHVARLPYDAEAALNDPREPVRAALLEEIAQNESRTVLLKAYQTYQGLNKKDLVGRFLGTRASSQRSLAMLFYAMHTDADQRRLAAWLRFFHPEISDLALSGLAKAYGNPRLNIADFGYLLDRHPLELWCALELLRNPQATFAEILGRSAEPVRISNRWLFQERNRKAQDLRLKIRIEQDAFERMTPYWKRMGFPFERLVSSYATAIGGSSDRPAALAEMMGVIVNDGLRLPTLHLTQLRLAGSTPYETVLEPASSVGERVIPAVVARTLRSALAGVVEHGTARRLAGAFFTPDGRKVISGGKTGSGDNRFEKFSRSGYVLSSRPVNRTATFVFYIGERYFGVVTAYVPGKEAEEYRFTSALPLTVLKLLAPEINERLSSESWIQPSPHRLQQAQKDPQPAQQGHWVRLVNTPQIHTGALPRLVTKPRVTEATQKIQLTSAPELAEPSPVEADPVETPPSQDLVEAAHQEG
ncbi:MAG: transglycosylase domain-containing protein [Acidobacteria bacterium]|nr:transglycosylase domain-containing protein [Acidobacteriota bacterium]